MLSAGIAIIFIIILFPIYLFIAVSFLGKPRRHKTVIQFLAIPVLFLISAVIGMYIMGIVIKIIISLL